MLKSTYWGPKKPEATTGYGRGFAQIVKREWYPFWYPVWDSRFFLGVPLLGRPYPFEFLI